MDRNKSPKHAIQSPVRGDLIEPLEMQAAIDCVRLGPPLASGFTEVEERPLAAA